MKSQGMTMATAIKGIPRNTGLMNCSKNPAGMISFTGLLLGSLRLGVWVLRGVYVLAL